MMDPIQPELHADMNELARLIDKYFNGPTPMGRKVGFFLTAFLFDAPGRFNYISNSDKLDVRAMLKEVIARIEGRMTDAEREEPTQEHLEELLEPFWHHPTASGDPGWFEVSEASKAILALFQKA